MSDVTTGKGFDSEFLTHPPRWFGRIESSETWRDNIAAQKFDKLPDIKGWGYRYKVRIFSWHTGDMNVIPPDQMVMANVVLPVTSGSGLGGFGETPSLSAGCIVTGFFMDGMGGQEPYIDGVLGNSNNNVPKERGGPTTTPNPTPTGASQNLDNLSIAQLKNLLNPARTPTKQEFAAATKARESAKVAGLSKEETERQVLIATVKASQESAPRQTKEKQSTLGYQLYDSTFNDPNIAKLPDFRTVSKLNLGGVPGPSNFPLYTFDSLHLDPIKAYLMQDEDKKTIRSLISPCKKKNSEVKGIQRVIKNLLNAVEKLKKFAGEATAFAESIISEVESLIDKASEYISSFMKSILNNVMSYIQNKIADGVKKVQGFLFPSEVPAFTSKLESGLEGLNCVFQKIIRGLASIIGALLKNLLDNAINGPLCATEGLISDFLSGGVLDEISGAIDSALTPLKSMITGFSGALNTGENIFNALDFMTGILEFFKCDEEKSCPDYNEINLAGPALPGGDPPAPVPGGNKTPSDGNKPVVGNSKNSSEGLSGGKAEAQPQSNIAQGTGSVSTTSSQPSGTEDTRTFGQIERDQLRQGISPNDVSFN